jgi:hypothetical protein
VASDAATQRDTVDSSVTAHAETPDAAAVRCHLDDDELDDRSSAQHEDERRPPLLLRPADRDPVADQMDAADARRARPRTLLLNASTGARGGACAGTRCPAAARSAACASSGSPAAAARSAPAGSG